jgi:DNA-binding transcriptional LysR family regulator
MTLDGKIEDLNDIIVFVAVAERGSFTRAAASLHLSLPSVSRRVKNLEDALQVQLFVRSTRHLSLTDAGRFYYERCARILSELNLLHEEIGGLTQGLKGSIRVYAPLGFGEQVLPDIAMKFGRLYPDIVTELRIGDRSTNPTEKGVDIAIRTAELADSSLASCELGDLIYHVCAARSYLEARGEPLGPEDLAAHNCLVHTNQPSSDVWRFEAQGKPVDVPVKGDLRSNSGSVVFRVCMAGAGIARLPEYDARAGVESGKLKILFPGQLNFTRTMRAYYPRSSHMPVRIDRFLKFLRSEIGPYLRPLS